MSTKKIIVIGITVFLAILLTLTIIFSYMIYSKNANGQQKEKEKISYHLGELYSNLKDTHRILKCNIVIEITDKDLIKEFDNKKFIITNEINKIIRNKKEEEIEGSEGQITLQNEITESLSKIFGTNEITNIYFEELIVQ